ncbi:MAG: transcription-repair coupling factor [Candidatus Geothermincolia bacterium]
MSKNNIAREILDRALGWERARDVVEAVQGGGEARISTSEALVPLLAAVLYRTVGGPLVVASATHAAALAADIDCFIPGEAFHLPGAGPGGDWLRPYDEAVGKRLKAARALSEGKVAVIGVEALVGGMPATLEAPWPLKFEAGAELDLETTLRLLVDGGYEREYTVDGWGRFAVRGGIIDIFPSTADRPVRIELIGDRIESIREFNVVSQRSAGPIENVEVFPASDQSPTTVLPGEGGEAGHHGAAVAGARVLAINPQVIEARAIEFTTDAGLEPPTAPLLPGWGKTVAAETIGGAGSEAVNFPGGPAHEFRGDLSAAVAEWGKTISSGGDVFLLLDGKGQVERARDLWQESGKGRGAPRGGVGTLRRGFEIPELSLSLFTSADILGRRERPRAPHRVSSGTPVSSYAELEVDGYVVHVDQGIGIYRGLTSQKVMGVTREYLLLEYAEGDKLYVPTAQLDKVQRYVGGEHPSVHRLRAREWTRSRKAARRSAEKTARELLRLYMERKSNHGFSFSGDTTWQHEIEQAFPYEDTPDQARAVREVKADMESGVAMDRLICGDVGYGKTEVALRAAMKAALDSRQVAVLVPTTVLARQHYETFRERFAPFPIKVEMLSRFLSRKQQDGVIGRVRRGETDIIIGTHRMLQDDVAFKELGLLVVDEEQRFGVTHKERLRKLQRNVDTLTLTATPIPRTLQMSLSGVRDISVIDTPPEDRQAVATYVGEFDMELVGHAVNYELARGGQVFYVHNRVESIERIAERLRRAFEGVSIAVGHGQMHEDELERVMLEFADGMHGVLVCTTIIESGLDLPNVNTLIVDRADRLGLSQLYQIRGRVGRSGKRAYAYMFYPHREVLSDTAVARLATISEMTPLGSGMRVALRDLEIRGAGSLLGAEQSGQIEAVGFELYCELLKEAVEILKGEAPAPSREAVVELPVDAYIPDDYISDQETRVEEYRRLIVAGRAGRLEELAAEMEDRFGEAPAPVRQMIDVERLEIKAAAAGIESLTMRGNELQLKFFQGEDKAVKRARNYVEVESIIEEDGAYFDGESRTLYLKLRFAEVKNRQEELLLWLNSITDDIIKAGRPAS